MLNGKGIGVGRNEIFRSAKSVMHIVPMNAAFDAGRAVEGGEIVSRRM
jgi:hypothetical protein